MKAFVLCGIAAMTVAPALAQTSADATHQTVTLTGCVGSSADSSGFTLGDAMMIPGTAQPGAATPPPLPQTVPPPVPTTCPPSASPTGGLAPVPPGSAAAVPPPASPTAVPPPPASPAAAP